MINRPRFVFGFLPVFYAKSKDGWGHQKGPVVLLPESYGQALVHHELFHVKQWYITFGLMGFLMLHRYFRFRFEAAAYGESLRILKSDNADHYAKALASKHYNVRKSVSECRALILKRMADRRLF